MRIALVRAQQRHQPVVVERLAEVHEAPAAPGAEREVAEIGHGGSVPHRPPVLRGSVGDRISYFPQALYVLIRKTAPGVPVHEVNAAAFSSFVERGYLTSADARTMPYNLEAAPDGSARPFVRQHVPDEDYERQGRRIGHLYPAAIGPFGPSLGHSVTMPGMRSYSVISSNDELLEPGMTFVVHPQWYEPGRVGCNIGNCLLVTETGVENLNAHTPVAPFRVPG